MKINILSLMLAIFSTTTVFGMLAGKKYEVICRTFHNGDLENNLPTVVTSINNTLSENPNIIEVSAPSISSLYTYEHSARRGDICITVTSKAKPND